MSIIATKQAIEVILSLEIFPKKIQNPENEWISNIFEIEKMNFNFFLKFFLLKSIF